MRNFRITFLIVGSLFVFGIYALARIPKQEFPEYTIRQGVVVGVYPGATAEEVEEQLAKPLEQFRQLLLMEQNAHAARQDIQDSVLLHICPPLYTNI